MKNLIIQHFVQGKSGLDPNRQMEDGMPMLVKRSSENVAAYAERFGAEYKMLDGTPFRPHLTYKTQKCCIVNEEYDEYDVVVAMDTDAFFTKKCTENLFLETGIAYSGEVQRSGKAKCLRLLNGHPKFQKWDTSFWSGAVYVLNREQRIAMRESITQDMEPIFEILDKGEVWDEGVFQVLAGMIGIKECSLDRKWNYDSYLPNPHKANIIHVRHRPLTRDQNYMTLKVAGVI